MVRGSQRSKTKWLATETPSSTVSASGTTISVLLNPSNLSEMTEPTLVRTRGWFEASVGAGAGNAYFTVGIAAVAFPAAGSPVPPNPFEQPEDWLWWSKPAVLVDYGSGQRYIRLEIDGRAGRRFETGTTGLVLVVDNSPLSVATVEYHCGLHLLFKQA
jgi:hypothetical protein